MRNRFRSFTALLIVSILITGAASAHSGRTDSSGGHRDNKNASGLGSYHYHHGYPAHLHTGGVCPYDFSDKTSHSSGSSSGASSGSSGSYSGSSGGSTTVTTAASVSDRFDDGYSYGYADAQKKFDDGVTRTDVDAAYKNGYLDAQKKYDDGVTQPDVDAAYEKGRAEQLDEQNEALAEQKKTLRIYHGVFALAACLLCASVASMRGRAKLQETVRKMQDAARNQAAIQHDALSEARNSLSSLMLQHNALEEHARLLERKIEEYEQESSRRNQAFQAMQTELLLGRSSKPENDPLVSPNHPHSTISAPNTTFLTTIYTYQNQHFSQETNTAVRK